MSLGCAVCSVGFLKRLVSTELQRLKWQSGIGKSMVDFNETPLAVGGQSHVAMIRHESTPVSWKVCRQAYFVSIGTAALGQTGVNRSDSVPSKLDSLCARPQFLEELWSKLHGFAES